MNAFRNRGFRVANSSPEVKAAYTGFLLFALLGYVTFVFIGLLRVGPGYQDIVTHYRGSELDQAEAFPMTLSQLLEDAHAHAFIEGLILLVLTHLFVATSVKLRMKVGLIVIAFGSHLADLVLPWLIRYVAAGFAWGQLSAWILMVTSALVMIAVPLYEMWFMGNR